MKHETIQDFPADICITEVTLTARNAVSRIDKPFSLGSEVQVFPGQRWEMTLSFLPMDRKTAGRLESFLLGLRGAAGGFRMGDPYRSLPEGKGKGVPVLRVAATAGSEVIETSGWVPNTPEQLAAGDLIEIKDRLHQVIESTNSDSSGYATLTIWPTLRETLPVGEAVKIRNARGVFSLTGSAQQFSRNSAEQFSTRLSAVEVI